MGTTGGEILDFRACRHDFSHWVREVFSDPELATQIARAERRWRSREIPDLCRGLVALLAARYGSEDLDRDTR